MTVSSSQNQSKPPSHALSLWVEGHKSSPPGESKPWKSF